MADSERTARVARVIARAAEALGDQAKANRWLRKPHWRLGGRKPLDLLTTPQGTSQVERLLGQIEHGIIG